MEIKTDPWQDLSPSTSVAQLNAKRVSAEIPWACFWARNSEGGQILLWSTRRKSNSPHRPFPS